MGFATESHWVRTVADCQGKIEKVKTSENGADKTSKLWEDFSASLKNNNKNDDSRNFVSLQ